MPCYASSFSAAVRIATVVVEHEHGHRSTRVRLVLLPTGVQSLKTFHAVLAVCHTDSEPHTEPVRPAAPRHLAEEHPWQRE